MYDSKVAKLRWFLLPSEAMNFLATNKDSVGLSLVVSPRPFCPRVYPARGNNDVDSNKTVPDKMQYQGSIPSQILQSSSWNFVEPPNSISFPHNRFMSDVDSGMSNSNSSELNFSGNEIEDDRDLFVTGATVTGPAICFGFGSFEDRSSSVDTEKEDNIDKTIIKGVLVDQSQIGTFTEQNTSQMFTVGNVSSNQQQSYPNPDVNTATLNSPTEGFCNPVMKKSVPTQTIYTDPQCFNANTGYSSTNQQYQDTNLVSSPVPQINYPAYSYPQPQNMAMGDTATTYVQLNSQSLSSVNSQQTYPPCYSPAQHQFQSQNSIDNTFNNTDGNIMNASSPVMAFSPTPYGYCGYSQIDQQPNNSYSSQPIDVQHQPFQQSFSPDPYKKFTSSFGGNTIENGVNEQIVEVAMRRVTDEIASQLKSEIRGVINQVEQGIDPNGLRERANSFTLKDRKIESLKRRTRTLSGHTFSSLGKSEEKVTFKAGTPESQESSSSDEAFEPDTENAENRLSKELEGSKKCVDCSAWTQRDRLAVNESLEIEKNKSNKWHCPAKNVFKPTLKVRITSSW